jgi:hypothetical protein
VTFDVAWTGVGAGDDGQHRRQQAKRARGTGNGRVTFDGVVLVDGPADHPTRPAPFIRVDTEK